MSEVGISEAAPRRFKLPLLAVALLRRLALGLVTMWLVSLIVFGLLFVVPRLNAKNAKPVEVMAAAIGGEHMTEDVKANIIRDLGLDRPLTVQYSLFVRDALTNNLKSYRNKDYVFSAIMRRFPYTLVLALVALFVYLAAAIPIAMWTATQAGKAVDRLALLLSIVAISIPTFWLGRLLQYYLGYRAGVFSVGGGAELANLPLPALTLGFGGAAYYSRLLHANLRGVLGQDYIRAARARGLGQRTVLMKHALKNALIPVITILGLDFASLLSGLIFTEKIFAWPGVGSLAVDAVLNQNAPMIMGTVLFSALMVVVMNIVVDFTYHLIDPRVRFE